MGVFNGDTGRIAAIDDENESVTLHFDDAGFAEYTYREMDNVTHAYAITTHKSQGSEYPCVVIPMNEYIPMLCTKNLLYTAVTRAKKMVVLIGKEKLFHMMCKNNQSTKRYTALRDLLAKT